MRRALYWILVPGILAMLAPQPAAAQIPRRFRAHLPARPARGAEGADPLAPGHETVTLAGLRLPVSDLVAIVDGAGELTDEAGLYELAIASAVELSGERHPLVGYLRIHFARWLDRAGRRHEALQQATLGEAILAPASTPGRTSRGCRNSEHRRLTTAGRRYPERACSS